MQRQGHSFIRITVYILAALILGVALVGFQVYQIIIKPIPIDNHKPAVALSSAIESRIILVEKSTTAQSLVKTMHAQGWIGSVRLWTWFIRMQGWSEKLRSGIYQVQIGESVQHLLKRIVVGDVLHKSFMIQSGATVAQISQALKRAPFLNYQLSDWSAAITQHNSAEGLLFADTYDYDAGSSGQDLLRRAHADLQQVLKSAWQNRNPALPYHHAYELLIVASILEKEASIPEERRLISGVIINRLKLHMFLQMDPTVIYALGDAYQGKLSHEQMAIDSPFNTYRYKGLPPTPIAMVSIDAIDAAAHPHLSAYLYFVAKGDGTHEFHVKYSDHLKAINHYMRKQS